MHSNTSDDQSKPDIEFIMSEIRAGIRQAENATERELPEPSASAIEHNLYACLREINQNHRVELPPPEGLKGRLRTRLYALLAQPFESINRYHLLLLHFLNKLMKVLDGTNDELTGELLTQTRNRMDLIEVMSRRLADLERKVEILEERLAEKDVR